MGKTFDYNYFLQSQVKYLEAEILICDKKIDYHAMMAEPKMADLYRDKRRIAANKLQSILDYQTKPQPKEQKIEKLNLFQRFLQRFFWFIPF